MFFLRISDLRPIKLYIGYFLVYLIHFIGEADETRCILRDMAVDNSMWCFKIFMLHFFYFPRHYFECFETVILSSPV